MLLISYHNIHLFHFMTKTVASHLLVCDLCHYEASSRYSAFWCLMVGSVAVCFHHLIKIIVVENFNF